MNNVTHYLQDHWRQLIIGIFIAVVGYFVVFNGIMTLTPGYSIQEIAAQKSSASLQIILSNPLEAPYKLLVWVALKLGHHSIAITRIAAGLAAIASAILFYFIVYSLFSRRIAIFATILFVTSSGFLHASHLGTPLALQLFGVLALLALIPGYLLLKGKLLPVYVSVITIAALLYIPGLLWFVLFGIIILNKRIVSTLRQMTVKHQVLICLIFTVLVAPLIWAYISNPSLLLTSLGLSSSLPTINELTSRTELFVRSLLWSGQGPAEIMLVGAPLFNIIEFGLLFIGICVQFKKPRLKSNYFVLGATVFTVLLIIIGDVLTYIVLTPLIALLMAGGLFYLLTQWHKVFPVNPVAHTIGTILVFGLVAVSALFHIRAFYSAWPNSTPTHQSFSAEQPTQYLDRAAPPANEEATGPAF